METNNAAARRLTHPGEIWREDVIPALEQPITKIAEMLGVSRQTLHQVLGEKRPVTTDLALRFAKLTGTSAGLWLRMQLAHDLAAAERGMAEQLAGIPELQVKKAA